MGEFVATGLAVEVGVVVGAVVLVGFGDGAGVAVGLLVLFEIVPLYTMKPAAEATTIIATSAMAMYLLIMLSHFRCYQSVISSCINISQLKTTKVTSKTVKLSKKPSKLWHLL